MYDLSFLENKKILITGGSGSIGSELITTLLQHSSVDTIRILSNDEDGLHRLQQLAGPGKQKLRLLLGDIRDKERLMRASEQVDIIFHLAALKHIYLSEFTPFESVYTNVIGTQNVIDAGMASDVEKVILSSSDKAANPSSVLGATKLLAEKLITAANIAKGRRNTIFSSVRFGNILGSRGSIIHSLRQDLLANRKLRLTHPEMTRFIMHTEEAISSLFHALDVMQGGEVFVFKMPTVKISDLLSAFLKKHRGDMRNMGDESEFEILGSRPGEKLHEDLVTEEESSHTLELSDMYIIIPTIPDLSSNLLRHYKKLGGKQADFRTFSSRESSYALSRSEISDLIFKIDLELT
jgi:UDP-N-acetylglucosamine 4,6-dehydratase